MGKRGISELITFVLIIGITLSAFGIIYAFIFPTVKDGINIQKECSNSQLYIDSIKGYTCYDSSYSTVNVQVKRGPENISLSGLQFIVSEGGDTKTFNLAGNASLSSPLGRLLEQSYESLLLLLHSNENSGLISDDSSQYNNDGTLVNMGLGSLNNGSSGWNSSGKFSNGISFDGIDDCMIIANESRFDFDKENSFSFTTWIKFNDTINPGALISKGRITNFVGYFISISPMDSGEQNLAFFLNTAASCSTDKCLISYADANITSYNDNQFHHVAMTYDGSGLYTGVKFYIDGVLNTTKLNYGSAVNPSFSALNNYPLSIACRNLQSSYLSSTMDEFNVWNRTLTAEEIFSIYQKGIITSVQGESDILDPNAEKVYQVPLSLLGLTSADEVSVAPVVKIGNKNHVCNAVPKVALSKC